jgi:hypothetical protein
VSVLALAFISPRDSVTHIKKIITALTCFRRRARSKSNRSSWLNLRLATKWVCLLLLHSRKAIKHWLLLEIWLGLSECIVVIHKIVWSVLLLVLVLLCWLVELSLLPSSKWVILLISEWIRLLEL